MGIFFIFLFKQDDIIYYFISFNFKVIFLMLYNFYLKQNIRKNDYILISHS